MRGIEHGHDCYRNNGKVDDLYRVGALHGQNAAIISKGRRLRRETGEHETKRQDQTRQLRVAEQQVRKILPPDIQDHAHHDGKSHQTACSGQEVGVTLACRLLHAVPNVTRQGVAHAQQHSRKQPGRLTAQQQILAQPDRAEQPAEKGDQDQAGSEDAELGRHGQSQIPQKWMKLGAGSDGLWNFVRGPGRLHYWCAQRRQECLIWNVFTHRCILEPGKILRSFFRASHLERLYSSPNPVCTFCSCPLRRLAENQEPGGREAIPGFRCRANKASPCESQAPCDSNRPVNPNRRA